ncbi:MAG: hypothetical protein QXF52_02890 [Thermoproteota archaeon]
MEQELVAKVEELMSSLDSAREYKEIAKAMIDSSLILSSVILTTLSAILLFNLLELLGYINTFFIFPTLVLYPVTFYLLLLIIPIGVFIGRRRVSRRRMEDWREILKEGPLGAIKLLTELDWKAAFEDLRTMKWALIARAIGGIVIHYLLIQLLAFIIHITLLLIFRESAYSSNYFAYMDMYYLAIYLISIPIAIFRSRSDIKKYYQKLGSVDYLLWSLRWLYNEFKGMKFEA